MRWVLVFVVGCSSSPKPPAGGWAPLPPEGTAKVPPDAPPLAPEIATVATNALGSFDDPPTFPLTGPACMPAGDYTVTFDLSAAKFDARGMDQELCVKMAAVLPRDQLAEMKLGFDGGQLAVDWPDRKAVIAVRTCSFAMQGPPFAAHVTFADGAGTGTASYSLGSPNHPDEGCSVRDAKFTITKR